MSDNTFDATDSPEQQPAPEPQSAAPAGSDTDRAASRDPTKHLPDEALLREVQDKAWIQHEMTAEAGRASTSGPVTREHWVKVLTDCAAAVQRAVRTAEEGGVDAGDITRARELGAKGVRWSEEAARPYSALLDQAPRDQTPTGSAAGPATADHRRALVTTTRSTEPSRDLDDAIATVLDGQAEKGWQSDDVASQPKSDPAPGTGPEAAP
ncbi:hypothetical protein [Nocardia transvalensis]|uniref:hypothetical protein n=1 Tax=Nocardia transvalensis TaxID=37333 RepID=UPI0018931038|nr:hypothetical protein [Nocardia transvalensis]MBF6331824.1 hypothetical protein [Nocardia transvalensis]